MSLIDSIKFDDVEFAWSQQSSFPSCYVHQVNVFPAVYFADKSELFAILRPLDLVTDLDPCHVLIFENGPNLSGGSVHGMNGVDVLQTIQSLQQKLTGSGDPVDSGGVIFARVAG